MRAFSWAKTLKPRKSWRAPLKTPELTLGDLVDRYLPYAERKLKASTYSGVVLHLRKHWAPLHPCALKELERRHVAANLSRISASSGPIGANRSRAALSALFSWAIGEGVSDSNPVVGTNLSNEVSRDRTFTDEELRLIWLHAGSGQYGAIVRLLMLTGQRRDEVGAMRSIELKLEQGLWTIHPARTKNGRAHDVPLSPTAIEILRACPRLPGREFVFGEGPGPFSGWSKAKASLDKRMLSAGPLAPWRLHDLRRTVATRLGDLGVLPHVVEAILNHVSGHKAGVAGVYNRSVYAPEKRAALEKWAEYISNLNIGT